MRWSGAEANCVSADDTFFVTAKPLGDQRRAEGSLPSASLIECYRRALPLAEAANDRETLSKVLDELGAIHSSLADDVLAAAFTRRALVLYEQQQKDADVERLRARLEQLERKLAGN